MIKEALKNVTTSTVGVLGATGLTAIELVLAQQIVAVGRETKEIAASHLGSIGWIRRASGWLGRRAPMRWYKQWRFNRQASYLMGRSLEMLGTALIAGQASKIPGLTPIARNIVKELAEAALIIQAGQIAGEVLTPTMRGMLQKMQQLRALKEGDAATEQAAPAQPAAGS